MKILTEEDKRNFLEWSEGNKYLYELLCICCENGISTFASCGGHENGNDFPYIGIIVNDKSIPYIKSILGQLQEMQNIVISTSARGRNPICEDNELRGITFGAHNYNCCEMFYKMQKGIKEFKKEIELLPKASAFYESVKRFNLISRDEIQQMIEDNIVEGTTFSTTTQDYLEFQKNKSPVKNNRVIRFIKKLLPFSKSGVQNYEKLQKKYGFLQREYHEEKSSKMDQYRIENFNSQENPFKDIRKISDIDAIEVEGVTLSRETLKDFIEEPCLDACRHLYDLNIETTMSSANKKDVGDYAYINIATDTLSSENNQILLEMSKREGMENKFEVRKQHGSAPRKVISIRTPINEDTTVEDVKRNFMEMISGLKMQDVLYERFSSNEVIQFIKECFGQDVEIDDNLIQEMDYYYSADDDVYFHGKELLDKHLTFKNKEKELEK